MWCRAENLCHSLRNGTAEMWLAVGDGPGDCQRLKDNPEFMESNLRVMQAGGPTLLHAFLNSAHSRDLA